MNTQNDLILISMHSLKAFTSVLRDFFLEIGLTKLTNGSIITNNDK